MSDLSRSETSARGVKDAVNVALDAVETAGWELMEFAGPGPLTQRLGDILKEFEQWKADAWEALDD